jgi:hypothetical protein
LTPIDIVRFHKTHFSGKPYNLTIVGSKKNVDLKSLERYGPVEAVPMNILFPY